MCLGCGLEEETFEHVLTCSLPSTHAVHNQLLQQLQTSLTNIQTPQPVVDCIMHGFAAWIHPPQQSRAPTAGSVCPLDIMLTQAYHEQFYKSGWYQLCLGRISEKWSKIIKLMWGHTTSKSNTEYWASHFIAAIWRFTTAMWTH